MSGFRSIAEIGMGAMFLIGAAFNSFWTLGHTDEFYGSFADGAWLSPMRSLIRNVVIPNARTFTVLLILFQMTVAILILTRGDLVRPALIIGGVFAVVAALASNPGGTVGNLMLAAIQFTLAASR